MKNLKCFLTAFLTSLSMVVWYSVFLMLINNKTAIILQANVVPLLLQFIFIIKYISSSVVVMPGEVNLKQFIAGYIIADAAICLPMMWGKSVFSFLAEMLIGQTVLLLIYTIAKRRPSAKPSLWLKWRTENELVCPAA